MYIALIRPRRDYRRIVYDLAAKSILADGRWRWKKMCSISLSSMCLQVKVRKLPLDLCCKQLLVN